MLKSLANASLFLLLLGQRVSANQYQTWSETAFTGLQDFYNNSTGLWQNDWWQSANALTTLSNMVALDSKNRSMIVDEIMPNTFKEAQAYNIRKNRNTKRDAADNTTTPWTNGFYDDEGWWAMAWISAYDVTNRTDYLDAAEGIFNDMTQGWGTKCSPGGLWWDKIHSAINTIENVLFMEVAAYLARRVPSKRKYYMDWAVKEWAWLQEKSEFWNATSNLVNGHVNGTTCVHTDTNGFTYSQGALMQALIEMSGVTGNESYLQQAVRTADAVMNVYQTKTDPGILHEPVGGNPGMPSSVQQFKGVFMRALMRLYQVQPKAAYLNFAEKNAQSIWQNARQGDKLGFLWAGPFAGPADMSMQSSAMDALVAAWSMSV